MGKGDKWVHTFPKGISPKVNVIARLEFELATYDVAVQLATETHLNQKGLELYDLNPFFLLFFFFF